MVFGVIIVMIKHSGGLMRLVKIGLQMNCTILM